MSTTHTIFTTDGARCWHRGDGALIVSLGGERPRVGAGVLEALERAVDVAERGHGALVVAADGPHFAFGADLDEAFDAVAAGRPRVLEEALVRYQSAMLALRRARVPAVAAVRGVAVSGGCEVLMHCDRVVAHPQSYIGLQEARVGVLPGGGGVKEFARRAALAAGDGDLHPFIAVAFTRLAAGALATSADEAKQLGYLQPDDAVVDGDDLLAEAVRQGLALREGGYAPPAANPSIRVAGRESLERLRRDQRQLLADADLTPHQLAVGDAIAAVLCGGDVDAGAVDEARLLRLEREHFLALASTQETAARLAHLRSRR